MGILLGSEGFLLGSSRQTLVSFPPTEQGYLFVDVRSDEDLNRVIEILQNEHFQGYVPCLTTNAIAGCPERSVTP